MKIELNKLLSDDLYFEIILNEDVYSTSEEIAEALNLSTDIYNEILIEKVICHKDYTLCKNARYDVYDDLVFLAHDISRETYLKRFKEAFTKQLILLALGGKLNEGWFN